MADTPKPRGRPPLVRGEPPARVQVRIGAADYDHAWRRARNEDISVAELLRRGLRRVLADPDDGT